MKKTFALLISMLIITQLSGQWSVGPRAGVNFCVTKGKWNEFDNTEYKWIGAPTLGGTLGYTFKDWLSLHADLLYKKMGNVSEYSYEDGLREESSVLIREKERYNCIQLVISAKYLYNLTFMSIFFLFGPYCTFKFGGRLIVDDGTNTSRSRIVWDQWPDSRAADDDWYVDPDYNRRFDFGLNIGAGARKELGKGQIEFNFRFGYGLLDLNKFDSKEDKKDAKDNGYKGYHSMNTAITVAYLIPFGDR